MRIEPTCNPALPRLAWCARIAKDSGVARVEHGRDVTASQELVFEGAWAGPFHLGNPAASVASLGSGAQLAQDALLFVTPSHLLEPLFAIRVGPELVVSNSLAFALERTRDSVSTHYRYYQFDFMRNMRGGWRKHPSIRTREGRCVQLWYHANVLVRENLTIDVRQKPLPPSFRDYAQYYGFLAQLVKDVSRNAADAARHVTFSPLATISAGYDSPACCVLAKDVGCTEAVTIATARPGFDSEDDSGVEIAQRLGLSVQTFDRLDYLRLPGFPEAEFLATGAGGEEVVFAPLERALERRLLFTGYLGDTVWGRSPARINENLYMLYPGGSSLGEFRLRCGFVHFPIPFIGYIRHPSIVSISRSAEMQPWTLGNDYDRPIARRIVEEAGVPRTAFGRTKMAVTQPLWQALDPERILTERSYRDLRQFCAPIPLFGSSLGRWYFRVMRALYDVNLRVNWRLVPLLKRLGIVMPGTPIVSERYSMDRGLNSLVFHWGLDRTLARYRV